MRGAPLFLKLIGLLSLVLLLAIVGILQLRPAAEGNAYLTEVHLKLHKLTQLTVLQEELDASTLDLETADQAVIRALTQLNDYDYSSGNAKQVQLLEQNILARLHELLLLKKAGVQSLNNAQYAKMEPSALAGGGEPTRPITVSHGQTDPTGDKEAAAMTAAASAASRKLAMDQDVSRRRELFVRGAWSRWTENSKRIRSQILGDLVLLDRLVATSIL